MEIRGAATGGCELTNHRVCSELTRVIHQSVCRRFTRFRPYTGTGAGTGTAPPPGLGLGYLPPAPVSPVPCARAVAVLRPRGPQPRPPVYAAALSAVVASESDTECLGVGMAVA